MGNISREEFDEEEALKVFQETIQNKTLNEEFQNLLKKTNQIRFFEMYNDIKKFKRLDDEREREDDSKLFIIKFSKEIPKTINLKNKQIVDENYFEELEIYSLEKLIRQHEKFRISKFYKDFQHGEQFKKEFDPKMDE